MQYKTIILEKKNGIATLTLNRPETLNAWNDEMSGEATDAINEIDEDENTKVLIVTGAGRGFSSGLDVREELTRIAEGASVTIFERIMQGKPSVVTMPLQLRRMDKPIIGAINGIAAGAGFAIALACDLRIASERAQFSMAFILRGLIPDTGGTFFLSKLVGSAKACELILTGDTINANEAERIGLVNKVVPQEKLMEATEELANKLVKRAPIALKYAKRAIYKGLTEVDLASHIDYELALNRMCTHTEDFKEAVKAFLEKREPVFKGK
jgi:2-(1,2-epoxy-1,2-dihydrophenyl)acetyl-CoA isomerase